MTRTEHATLTKELKGKITAKRCREIIDLLLGEVEISPDPYDPKFGADKLCACGHQYYRHFDTYEDMRPVGCKYCDCDQFSLNPSQNEGTP